MAYASTVKRAHGATVSFDSGDAIDNCTIIGIAGNSYDLIEKTSLGASRKEYDASDTPDSDEITITMPEVGAAFYSSGDEVAVEITLPTLSGSFGFNALIIKDMPQPAEVGGLLYREITLKPISTPSFG